MDWAQAAGYGAVGGALVELVIANGRLLAWQAARHKARDEKRRRLPPLRHYIDPTADLAAGLSRVALGALTGWLLHSQVTGLYAAVAAGASAPALIRQLGTFGSVREIVQGPAPDGDGAAGDRGRSEEVAP
ncbi:hypothetical protein ACPC54_39980 [Kitasatospora sp. NPDC094028]